MILPLGVEPLVVVDIDALREEIAAEIARSRIKALRGGKGLYRSEEDERSEG